MIFDPTGLIVTALKWIAILFLFAIPVILICIWTGILFLFFALLPFSLLPFIIPGILIYLTRKDKRNEH